LVHSARRTSHIGEYPALISVKCARMSSEGPSPLRALSSPSRGKTAAMERQSHHLSYEVHLARRKELLCDFFVGSWIGG